MSYQAKDSQILGQQLKVQELVIRFADVGLYTASGTTVTVDIQETLSSVPLVLFHDNSAGTLATLAQSAIAVSGDSVTVTLAAALAADDVLVIKYIVSE